MRVLAIGDIHTKLWIVDKVRQLTDDYDQIVFVGDYADDWNASPLESINTWKELRSLSHSEPKVKLVTGNHDYIYVHKTPTKQSGYNQLTQFLLDTNKGLKEWLQKLPLTLKIDGVTYSHAGITDTWVGDPSNLWFDCSPLWARPPWADYRDIPQVFGHTPQKTCLEVQLNAWCIDTFSTDPNGNPLGDYTVLEITNGKFKKVKL
jgi:predicted MPP superfamily phosphohydrolase